MTTALRLTTLPIALAAVLASAQGDGRAQQRAEKPPPKAEREEPQHPPESGESHLLFFERVLLVAGKSKLGRTDFEIGKEVFHRSRKQPDVVDVAITFLQEPRAPRPVSLDLVEAVVENAERTGDSPWRLAELDLRRSGDLWLVKKLVFMRYDAGEDLPLESGHDILKALRHAMDAADTEGVTYEPQTIRVTRRKTNGDRWLNLDCDVLGERFRRGYVRLLDVFARMCDDDDGPFTGLGDARGEHLLQRSDVPGASYEFVLSLRPPSVDEVGK